MRRCIVQQRNATVAAVRPRRVTRREPFTDRVKVLVSSGSGGDGASVMSREHNNEFAGPGGGNGGRGGHVFLRTSRQYSDLAHIGAFGGQVAARDGTVGYGRNAFGHAGQDLIIDVPIGTQVIDVDTNAVVYDLDEDDVEVLLLEGGLGGKGNASFANRRHHSPVESTRGLPGNTILAQFELKSIADCGLVGLPNAGKSSILGAVSTSKPKVAAYPFTTLHPTIGVVQDIRGNSCRICDLPGLTEGAYENRGLGHQFLRHVERARYLCLVVDMHAPCLVEAEGSCSAFVQPWDVVQLLQQELEYYHPGLSERALMVLANKMDLTYDAQGNRLRDKFDELRRRTLLPAFAVSAAQAHVAGIDSPSCGLSEAMQFLCQTVFSKKAQEAEGVLRRKHHELHHLEKQFRARNRGVFSSVAPPQSKAWPPEQYQGHDGSSLVDQQLDNVHGESGLDEPFDSYAQLPTSGNLTRWRDLSTNGRQRTVAESSAAVDSRSRNA